MSVVGKRALVGGTLLFLAWSGIWWLFPRHRAELPPSLAQLVARVCWEEPWYYRVLKRTDTLRFLPKRWLAPDTPPFKLGALWEFGRLGTNAWPAVPVLLERVKGRNPETAISAAQALAFVRADQDPDWTGLRRDLYGQTSAARVFHWMLLTGSEPRFGLIGLAATGPAAVIARGDVLDLLKHSQQPELRAQAVLALGAMNSKTNCMPMLKDILRNEDEWPVVSAAAAQALAAAAPDDPGTSRLLHEALQNRRSPVRLAGARALWTLGTPAEQLLPVLTTLLHHKLASVRKGALDVLAEMGTAAGQSRAKVEPLLDDENETVRRAAGAAWKSVTGGAAANFNRAASLKPLPH